MINSWNVNLRVVYDLNWATPNYLVESLSNVKNCKQMIYKRYVKFLSSLESNRRPELRALLSIVKNNCRSITGGNLRKILIDSGVKIEPGVTQIQSLNSYTVYETPEGQEWRLPLLTSLLELRDSRWELQYDEECDKMTEDDISVMINNVCIG